MIDAGIVRGSAEQAKPLVIGLDTVYVHEDIEEIETEQGIEYQYHEYQYGKDEYILNVLEKQAGDIEYISIMADIDMEA